MCLLGSKAAPRQQCRNEFQLLHFKSLIAYRWGQLLLLGMASLFEPSSQFWTLAVQSLCVPLQSAHWVLGPDINFRRGILLLCTQCTCISVHLYHCCSAATAGAQGAWSEKHQEVIGSSFLPRRLAGNDCMKPKPLSFLWFLCSSLRGQAGGS